jgi:hypothetical protein
MSDVRQVVSLHICSVCLSALRFVLQCLAIGEHAATDVMVWSPAEVLGDAPDVEGGLAVRHIILLQTRQLRLDTIADTGTVSAGGCGGHELPYSQGRCVASISPGQ